MSEIISLAEFRSRISIIELATANGYTPNKKHSCQKYPVFDNPNTGNRIYILNPNNSSNQGYVNVYDDLDKGTLVDFVQKRLTTDFKNFNRADRSEFSNINAVLYNHLSRSEPERKTNAEHFKDIANRNKIGQTDTRFNMDLLDVKHLHNTYFLLSRGIKPITINHQNFAGAIYNVENNGFINTAFPYYDHTGALFFSTSIKDDIFNIQIPGSLQAISFYSQQLIKVLGIDKKFGLEKA